MNDDARMLNLGDLDTLIGELEIQFATVHDEIKAVIGLSDGNCTNDCTYVCTNGCTGGHCN